MRKQKITGIGCFAKPEKLSRIFKKMVKNYTLGQFEEFELINGHETDGQILLKALIAGKNSCTPWPHSDSGHIFGKTEVTGFYLTLRNQRLNLSIFSRGNRSGPEIFTTSLGELTKLRQKRIN